MAYWRTPEAEQSGVYGGPRECAGVPLGEDETPRPRRCCRRKGWRGSAVAQSHDPIIAVGFRRGATGEDEWIMAAVAPHGSDLLITSLARAGSGRRY